MSIDGFAVSALCPSCSASVLLCTGKEVSVLCDTQFDAVSLFTTADSQWLTVLAGLLKGLFVGWLLNVPGKCKCISGTDLHRQFYVLPQYTDTGPTSPSTDPITPGSW